MASNFVLLILIPMELRGDDVTRVELGRLLLDGHPVATKYSIGLVYVGAFLMQLGRWLGGEMLILQLLAPSLLTLTTFAVAGYVKIVTGSKLSSLISTSICAFSLATAYVAGFNSDLISACLITLGIILCSEGVPRLHALHRGLGLMAFALGVYNTPANLLPALLIGSLVLLVSRLPYLFVGGLLALMLVGFEATITNGGLSFSKYGVEGGAPNVLPWGSVTGFGYPLVFGVIGILFSLGRGLIFYVPATWFLAVRSPQKMTAASRLVGLHALILVPLYGSWWAWYGGVTFGPRFFLITVFAGALALGLSVGSYGLREWRKKAVVLLALMASSYVGIVGLVIGQTEEAFNTCVLVENFYLEPLCWYSAEYSSLLAPWWDTFRPPSTRQVLYGFFIAGATLFTMIRVLTSGLSRQTTISHPDFSVQGSNRTPSAGS